MTAMDRRTLDGEGRLEKKENIILDAEIQEMISNTAFRATLKNGHALVAYVSRVKRNNQGQNFKVGDTLQVQMSPFDMSRGQVVQL